MTLLEKFEAGRLRADEFPHQAHVRVAWALAQRYDRDQAYLRLVDGIRSIATRAGKPGAFHETITRAWFELIAGARDLDSHPELFDKSLLSRYYSPAVLATGREQWVEPDLGPLILTARTERRIAPPAGSVSRSADS